MKQATFAYSFQGFSHIKKEEKQGREFPCQDRSFSGDFESSEISETKDVTLSVKDSSNSFVQLSVDLNPHKASFSLICVSDGHGGAPYFRSQKGAEFAVQTAIELLSESIDKIKTALEEKNYTRVNSNLSTSFVRRWLIKVMTEIAGSNKNELLAEIRKLAEEKPKAAKVYSDELDRAQQLAQSYLKYSQRDGEEKEVNKELPDIIKEFTKLEIKSMYGCTVAVYFKIKDTPLWYAFKVGDSDIFASFDGNFVKPIKDDPNCHENVTTSLCDDNASKNFMFPEEKILEKQPETVFCSSDGVADSFPNEEFIKKLYSQFQFHFDEDGFEKTSSEIKETLPNLSERGSGDDISLAGIVSFDDSDSAKRERRLKARILADEYWNEGKYELIYLLFKPYIDKSESEFKYISAIYDYKETSKLSQQNLTREFLGQWNKTYTNFGELENDINPIIYQEKIKPEIDNLQKILLSMIEKETSKLLNQKLTREFLGEWSKTYTNFRELENDIDLNIYQVKIKTEIYKLQKMLLDMINKDIEDISVSKTQEYIDDLFNFSSTADSKILSYYKVIYEVRWLSMTYQICELNMFLEISDKIESNLKCLFTECKSDFIKNTSTSPQILLCNLCALKSKYWNMQK